MGGGRQTFHALRKRQLVGCVPCGGGAGLWDALVYTELVFRQAQSLFRVQHSSPDYQSRIILSFDSYLGLHHGGNHLIDLL